MFWTIMSSEFMQWRPGVGVRRLAILCGMIGLAIATFLFWAKAWRWADSVFWPHAHYAEVLKASDAIAEKDEHGNLVFILVRPSQSSLPPGFTVASDLP
jgi:hypothetical protein